ncbi:hypothetical protein HaLaN_13026 [Haematococcus lacustris]|uniref:Uncharacterized protein n=1 Tax=Haematococcus lacustris TaxID=44745 RepID=A0A699Z212_HAELA|nr:hypothetical protein HaLaN_13026 [Haematococcus lacustris]
MEANDQHTATELQRLQQSYQLRHGVELRQRLQQLCQAIQLLKGCNNSGREQLVAALPAQLDAQGWDAQQAGEEEGTAEWVE